jgi:hypothetical protein
LRLLKTWSPILPSLGELHEWSILFFDQKDNEKRRRVGKLRIPALAIRLDAFSPRELPQAMLSSSQPASGGAGLCSRGYEGAERVIGELSLLALLFLVGHTDGQKNVRSVQVVGATD